MTRFKWIPMAMIAVVLATACSGSDDNTAQESSTTSATSTSTEAALADQASLEFGAWTYDLETVESLLGEFSTYSSEVAEPPINVDVTVSEAGFGEFDTHVTSLNAAGSQLDVLYGSDHWLAKWAAAGWVVPIEEYCPDLTSYTDDITEFSLDGLTYDGQLYGLPYYSDLMYFIYNDQMLSDAGIDAPPTTWQEVAEQSRILQEQEIVENPFMLGLEIDSWFEEQLYAMIYSEGGELFDDDFAAVFETDSGPFYDAVEFLRSAVQDEGIMPAQTLQMSIQDVVLAFQQEDTAFAMVAGYMMRDLNNPEASSVVDAWEVAPMPGSTGGTAGFTRAYLLGSGALEDATTTEAACRFIEFHGGSVEFEGEEGFHVPKTWAIQNGLGFSIDSLWEDPEVEESFSATADIDVLQQQQEVAHAKDGMDAPWFAEWISFVRPEVQRALLGEQSTADTLQVMKQHWEQLSES